MTIVSKTVGRSPTVIANVEGRKAIRAQKVVLKVIFCAICLIVDLKCAQLAFAKDQQTLPFLVPNAPHGDNVSAVAVSSGGDFILSSSFDKTIKMWNTKDYRLLRTFVGHARYVNSISILPNSNEFVSAASDGAVILWDIVSGQQIQSYDHLSNSMVFSVATSGDGERMIAGGSNNEAVIWGKAAGNEILRLRGHSGAVLSVAFSPDGRFVLTGSEDNTVRLWNSYTGELLKTLIKSHGPIHCVTFSPDSAYIASAANDGHITIWNVHSGLEVRSFAGHGRAASSVLFTPDGRQLLSGSYDASLKLWDRETGTEIWSVTSEEGRINSLALERDAKFVLSGNSHHSISRWEIASGRLAKKIEGYAKSINDVAVSGDGRLVAAGGNDRTIRIWDTDTWRLTQILKGHTDNITSLGFSSDGQRLVSGSRDKSVFVWDVKTGSIIYKFIKHVSWISSSSFLPNSYNIVSSSYDGSVKLWNSTSGEVQFDIKNPDTVLSVSSSPNGEFIVSGGYDKKIRIINSRNGNIIETLDGHSRFITSLSVSPDSRHILSASVDGTIKRWDAQSGETINTFEAHRGAVTAVRFSLDGELAISTGTDGVLKLWNLRSGKLERSNNIATVEITDAVPVPNTSFLIATAVDATLNILDFSTTEVRASIVSSSASNEWVIITPAGFFGGSENIAQTSDSFLSIVRGMEVFSVRQFYEHLYRPDLVEENIHGDVEGNYETGAHQLNLRKILDSGPPPSLELLKNKTQRIDDAVTLFVKVKDSGGGIGRKLLWRVNGKTQGDIDISLPDERTALQPLIVTNKLKIDLDKINVIEVVAYNASLLLSSLPIRLEVDSFGVTQRIRPKLWVLAIGVDKYEMPGYQLRYAVKDAETFAEALTSVSGGLFSNVQTVLLRDGDVHAEGIETVINRLATEMSSRDVFVLFLSGHGKAISGRYYFLPPNLMFSNGQSIKNDAISHDLWQRWLARIPAEKTLLIIDTCESSAASELIRGRAHETAMDQLEHATGQNIIAASRRAAFEGFNGHGVLTYAILEAFQQTHDESSNDAVYVDSLAQHIGRRVPALTREIYGETQEPVRKLTGSNFPLGFRTLPVITNGDCPAQSYYVVLRDETPRTSTGATAGTGSVIPKGYRVTAEVEGNWALVCRENTRLGYVPKDALLELK